MNFKEIAISLSQLVKKWQISRQEKDELIEEISHQSIDEQNDSTYRDFFMFWLIWVLVTYLWYVAFNSLSTIYLIFASLVISISMEKIIQRFTSKLKSRGAGIWLAYLLLLILIIGWVTIIIPFVWKQITQLAWITSSEIKQIQTSVSQNGVNWTIQSYHLPSFIQNFLNDTLSDPNLVQSINDWISNNLTTIVGSLSSYVQNVWWATISIASWFISWLFQVFFVLTLAVLFSIEKRSIVNAISKFGWQYEWTLHRKLDRTYEQLWIRLKSQLILCFFIGVTTLIGLWLLALFWVRITNVGSLALIAWLTEFIPYIWPILGSIPAILMGTINHWWVGFLSVWLLFFIIQRLENNILIPWIMNKTLWVSPLLIFICIVLGWSTLWFVGVLLWVPIAVIISIISE